MVIKYRERPPAEGTCRSAIKSVAEVNPMNAKAWKKLLSESEPFIFITTYDVETKDKDGRKETREVVNLPFFQCTVRAERRLRSDTGYFIAYQMLEAREIARDHYTNRYQKIPSWWGQFEVCQGFWAEPGPVLTYYGRYLCNPRHGLWVVFLTEWCVKVAATLL